MTQPSRTINTTGFWKTYIDSIKKFADTLHDDLLDVLVEVAVQDGVGAGWAHAHQVADAKDGDKGGLTPDLEYQG